MPPKSRTPSTMALIVPMAPEEALERRAERVERVRDLVESAKSTNTRRAYDADWKTFEEWCAKNGAQAFPADAETIALYVLARFDEGAKVKTIERALAGIAFSHRKRGVAWETPAVVREQMHGIRRTRAEAGERIEQKTPLSKSQLISIMATLGEDTIDVRDRALLLILWIGAFRRSEVAGLDVAQVKFVPREGLLIRPKTTKTDQEGKDEGKGLPLMTDHELCPVHSLRAWLDRAGIERGPLFRSVDRKGNVSKNRLSDHSIALVVKKLVKRIGLDPNEYSGHSARAGFMTSAAAEGKELHEIMSQSKHRSVAVARGYIRHGTVFTKNAAKGMF